MPTRLIRTGALCAVALGVTASTALAMPTGPGIVCETYPDSAFCRSSAPACSLCHTSPPLRNAFGEQVESELVPGSPRPIGQAAYNDALPDALIAVEQKDADGDGFSNLDEILAGSFPADGSSLPGEDAGACTPKQTWAYNVCDRDVAFTYRKVMLDFCGRSPTLSELVYVVDTPDPWAEVHAALDECLDAEFWMGRDGVVWNLANRKIRPTQSIKSGEDAGDIPLGDYYDDYNLFVYTQIDDHDARDLLLAQYLVRRTDGEPTTYEPVFVTALQDVQERGLLVGQLVDEQRRAGMLTSRWNLVFNTMFSAIPRTSAAQAYRAYLGLDIAKSEGLNPIPGEPIDYDGKGVSAPQCAFCHSTLDPLTYPFTRYNGLGGQGLPATYQPNRLAAFTASDGPAVADAPESGVVLGQPVADLLDWADVAANSDEFASATVMDYWKLIVGDPPEGPEMEEFSQLVASFASDNGYSVERMLHELIETEAYSVP